MSHTEPGGSQPAWEDFVGRHGVGDVLDGRVGVRRAPRRGGPTEPGSDVPVRIAEIDHEKRRMKLVAP